MSKIKASEFAGQVRLMGKRRYIAVPATLTNFKKGTLVLVQKLPKRRN